MSVIIQHKIAITLIIKSSNAFKKPSSLDQWLQRIPEPPQVYWVQTLFPNPSRVYLLRLCLLLCHPFSRVWPLRCVTLANIRWKRKGWNVGSVNTFHFSCCFQLVFYRPTPKCLGCTAFGTNILPKWHTAHLPTGPFGRTLLRASFIIMDHGCGSCFLSHVTSPNSSHLRPWLMASAGHSLRAVNAYPLSRRNYDRRCRIRARVTGRLAKR